MWPRALRRAQATAHRTVRFSRGYNGNPHQHHGPHTTYFQQPPPEPPAPRRRILRSILLGTALFGLGVYTHAFLTDVPLFGWEEMSEEEMSGEEKVLSAMAAAAQDTMARQAPGMDLEAANEYLLLRSGFAISDMYAVAHMCTLPSNLPCEDTDHSGAFTLFNDPTRDWAVWSIFDGHAGPRTAQLLKESLPLVVGGRLWEERCMDRPYVPNDELISQTIKDAFKYVDHEIMNEVSKSLRSDEGDMAKTIGFLSAAVAGSCALVTLFDPARSVLRVANTGDSRAVLGRWDRSAGKYVAVPMSTDHTGFNPTEVERLKRDHPDEDPVDPKTGRVHGLAVSRAFGDSRWKWPNDLTQMVHDKFWGPLPRPNGVIRTPPYLTAEPEVTETKIESGDHPDFLIMASDGLWDNMSSEDAVTCVQQWLDKYKPTNFLDKRVNVSSIADLFNRRQLESKNASYSKPSNLSADEDTYYDENERCLKWRVNPEHFVVEDDNCGVHLIKNALGGKRRNLFCGIMSMQPPLSRNVRDDITVHVIFFGQDTQPPITN